MFGREQACDVLVLHEALAPTQRAEQAGFEAWWREAQLPAILGLDGTLAGQVYTDADQHVWAVVEVEPGRGPDLVLEPSWRAARAEFTERWASLLASTSTAALEPLWRTSPRHLGKGTGGRLGTPDARPVRIARCEFVGSHQDTERFEDWYTNVHFADAVDRDTIATGLRYRATSGGVPSRWALYEHRTGDEAPPPPTALPRSGRDDYSRRWGASVLHRSLDDLEPLRR